MTESPASATPVPANQEVVLPTHDVAPVPFMSNKKRWLAFAVLGLGTLMNVLDTTIVNIAAPKIQSGLGFSDAGLAWVVNAYLLTFGGFLLLGGRLGDLYGPRKLFLWGLSAFTLASLGCGIAQTPTVLIVARAVQGLGAAVVAAVSLSIIMGLFPDGPGRAKAMGVFAMIASGGGAVGAVLGGVITAHFDWHVNFLINIPIGIAVFIGTTMLVPDSPGTAKGKLDIVGAALVTASLLLAVYAVVSAAQDGWATRPTALRFAGSALLMAAFIICERSVKNPLVPLGMFRQRNIVGSNAVGVLWAASMFAWFFLSSLYMQKVLGLDEQTIGLAFVPADVIMAIFSVSLSAKLVGKFGIRVPMTLGLVLAAVGLFLFSQAPSDGSILVHVLPGMLILGLGAGMAFNPLFLAAMSDAKPEEAGLASGLVNTSFMMGGALGLAVLTSLSAAKTASLSAVGSPQADALNGGYHLAFLVAFCACLVAAAIGAFGINAKAPHGGPDAPASMH